MHTADLYDAVYAFKDYSKEAGLLRRYLNDLGIYTGTMLELACGTGEYLKSFNNFERTGIDLCIRSLEIAQSKLPETEFLHQDMTTFDTEKEYDVILAMFGAVGYVRPQSLTEFFQCCHRHLATGGALLLEPWLEEDDFESGVFLTEGTIGGGTFSRIARAVSQNGMSILQFNYMYIEGNSVQTSYSEDRLFFHSRKSLLTCLEAANLEVSAVYGGFLDKSAVYVLKKTKKD